MRLLAAISLAALLGGVAATIAFCVGAPDAAGVAFALGALALTGGFTAVIGPLSTGGMPNDEPRPWPRRRGGAR